MLLVASVCTIAIEVIESKHIVNHFLNRIGKMSNVDNHKLSVVQSIQWGLKVPILRVNHRWGTFHTNIVIHNSLERATAPSLCQEYGILPLD